MNTNLNTFKHGDVVTCVRGTRARRRNRKSLVEGRTYTVASVIQPGVFTDGKGRRSGGLLLDPHTDLGGNPVEKMILWDSERFVLGAQAAQAAPAQAAGDPLATVVDTLITALQGLRTR
jgi:hypothetical protein